MHPSFLQPRGVLDQRLLDVLGLFLVALMLLDREVRRFHARAVVDLEVQHRVGLAHVAVDGAEVVHGRHDARTAAATNVGEERVELPGRGDDGTRDGLLGRRATP